MVDDSYLHKLTLTTPCRPLTTILFVFNRLSWDKGSDKRALPSLLLTSTFEEDLLPMRNLVTRFAKNDDGAALVEYGMLVGLIAVVCVGAVRILGGTVNTVFTTINTDLTGI
jgi:pilus assembly protein Flp/PilA